MVILLIRCPAKFTELPIGNIAATVFMLTLFGVCFASIAFGIGAYTGRRAISLGAGAYLAVVTYLCSSFLPQISGLGWVKYFSPFALVPRRRTAAQRRPLGLLRTPARRRRLFARSGFGSSAAAT